MRLLATGAGLAAAAAIGIVPVLAAPAGAATIHAVPAQECCTLPDIEDAINDAADDIAELTGSEDQEQGTSQEETGPQRRTAEDYEACWAELDASGETRYYFRDPCEFYE
ncbi:hypothetical protein [Actinoplanes italicus]|nr:hypothetical protein [Actinoplanes italicus]